MKCNYCNYETGNPDEMGLHNVTQHYRATVVNTEFGPKTTFAEIAKQESICQEAERIINGPRRESYGPVEESFEAIAKVWTGILNKKLKINVSKQEVALMLICFKAIRESNEHKRDNLVDIIGYTLLQEKLCQTKSGSDF